MLRVYSWQPLRSGRLMLWQCWQIDGYRCGNVTRQAFDAARDGARPSLGGFPGADAPGVGTEKTVHARCRR